MDLSVRPRVLVEWALRVTDLFLERDSFMDPQPFRANRFRDAEALSEVHII